ncbi:adhesive plaque matrix protein [Eurytemora carolleeae]|uniref:adhesive plaque matrix protein n=1 Tax=Eurytemora carolleeae TaxID=1294199 RepID=UPI000C77478F|nr:adhesive plaque matrix protein [Eurytemora carolleeae]|eukprot:XP_023323154.1 adhesive plaque matrix protein-like [Eurytemora affinis]
MFTFLISDIDVSIHKHKAFKASLLSPARGGSDSLPYGPVHGAKRESGYHHILQSYNPGHTSTPAPYASQRVDYKTPIDYRVDYKTPMAYPVEYKPSMDYPVDYKTPMDYSVDYKPQMNYPVDYTPQRTIQ